MIKEFNDNLTLAYLPVDELDEAAESFGLSKRFIERIRENSGPGYFLMRNARTQG